MIRFRHFRILAIVSLAAATGACATWSGPPADAPYYESYGYPDTYGGPGYYGPGYYQPGYYGGYWYAGGYYSPAPGYYAPYPYYPGTHIVIVDRHHDRPPPRPPDHGNPPRGGGDDRTPRDPVNPQPRGQPQHPFGVPDQAYRNRQPTTGVPPASPYAAGNRQPQAPQVAIPPRGPAPQQQQPLRPAAPQQQQIYRQSIPAPRVNVPPPSSPPRIGGGGHRGQEP